MIICIAEEYVKSKDDLKESIKLYGSYVMAKKLHSLNVLNSKSYALIISLKKGLSNKQLASILVEELSHDLTNDKKYKVFLKLLKREMPLTFVQIMEQSKIKIY